MVSIKISLLFITSSQEEICLSLSGFIEKTIQNFEQSKIIHFTQSMYVEHKGKGFLQQKRNVFTGLLNTLTSLP